MLSFKARISKHWDSYINAINMTYTTAKVMPIKNILLVISLINGNFLFNKSLPVIKRTMRAKSTKNKAMASAPPAK